jgi:GH43 family beta-xylosidase
MNLIQRSLLPSLVFIGLLASTGWLTQTVIGSDGSGEISLLLPLTKDEVKSDSQQLAYANPVWDDDFPDPFVLRVSNTYFAFSTNKRFGPEHIPVIKSNNLADWEKVGDALPRLPSWANSLEWLTWAPSVIQRGDRFVLYYSAPRIPTPHIPEERHCIGRAISNRPEGPYVDDSSAPFVCQPNFGGSIDPSPFLDSDGKLYLLWSASDRHNQPAGIWIQQLSDNGLTLIGNSTVLLEQNQSWESKRFEGPAMLKEGGRYYLFYSANYWESEDYAVGYATSQAITGPFTKPQNSPIFAKNPIAKGPGGQEFFTDANGKRWMAYHAWKPGAVGYESGGSRSFRIEPVSFQGGKPTIVGPSAGATIIRVYGAIREKWESLGAENGFLGEPLTDELGTPDGVGRYNHFQRGSIYWTPTTGAHEVHGAIRDKWAALGWERSPLGYPTSDEQVTVDGVGRVSFFQRGTIFWHPAVGAFAVYGAIGDKYRSISYERGYGYPVTDELGTPDGIGRFNHFQRGSIYWTPSTGAHLIYGAIRDKWASLGWERGFLGYPLTDELGTPDRVGRFNHFQRGSIYWTPTTGAHEVHGAIRDKWASLGWERSSLGYPTSDEIPTPNGKGRMNHFQRGKIYWYPTTGAYVLP